METKNSFVNIACPSCGQPANYNIIKNEYLCSYCGSEISVEDAHLQKKGFRELKKKQLKSSVKDFKFFSAKCTGCGAKIVFEKDEALTKCAFCSRALARKEYVEMDEVPELIIPFRITLDEAKDIFRKWCKDNSFKKEARHLKDHYDELNGFYLPYELVKGPISAKVTRLDTGGGYEECGGVIDDVFVNRSKQLDNLLLDGMEPFDLDEIKEFDFSYVAGHRVKIADVNDNQFGIRVSTEIRKDFTPTVQKVLETKGVLVIPQIENTLRLPVLLPVYYFTLGNSMIAINGQTGKVSVRAEKESYYIFLPWWLKAILATIVIGGVCFSAFFFFNRDVMMSLYFTGMLSFFNFIVTLCAYSDAEKEDLISSAGHKIFTSKEIYERKGKELVKSEKELKSYKVPPVFFREIDGEKKAVSIEYTTFKRSSLVALLALVVIFLPVIIALFLNGFNFEMIELGGSAAWFCIFVPVVPIYIVKTYRIDLYENPWIYILNPDGSKKRYKKPKKVLTEEEKKKNTKEIIQVIVGALFGPPICFATWFAIASFCVMCYLTAFGFD